MEPSLATVAGIMAAVALFVVTLVPLVYLIGSTFFAFAVTASKLLKRWLIDTFDMKWSDFE